MPVVTGKAYWAKLEKPAQKYNTTSAEDTEYCIDLTIDKATRKLLEGLNPSASIKNKNDDRGDFFTFKKNAFNRKGEALPKPRIVDAKKNDIKGTLIGNGSDVRVMFRSVEIENVPSMEGKNKFYLDAVQVVDLVPYAQSEEFDEVEGYIADGAVTGTNSEESAPF